MSVVGNPLVVIYLEFFHGWPGAMGLRRTIDEKYPSYHTVSTPHAISLTFHCDVDLNHLVEVASVSTVKLVCPLFLCWTPWKEVTTCSPHPLLKSKAATQIIWDSSAWVICVFTPWMIFYSCLSL